MCAIPALAWVQISLWWLFYPPGLMRCTFLLISMGCAGVLGAAAENDLLPEVYKSPLIKHSACL